MSKSKPTYTIYKIYDERGLVYIGRTIQKLDSRLRGHFYKQPNYRAIDIADVVRIEYATLETEADMLLYEMYLINLYKPVLNMSSKAKDCLTVSLPDLVFKQHIPRLFEKWKATILKNDIEYQENRKRKIQQDLDRHEMRRKWHRKEISEDEYYDWLEKVSDTNVRV